MFDREVRGVGHIHRASRIMTEAHFNLVNDEIPELAKTPKGRAVLEALRDGTITGLQLYIALKNDDLDSLAGDGATPLLAALEQWREMTRKRVATATHRVRGELITHLAAVAKPTTPLADLPKLLRKLKLSMPSARSFNLDLQYASAFLRDTVGRRHELYLDVRDIDVRTANPTTERNPLTPSEVVTLAAAFDRVWKAKQGGRGAEVFAMALTGMGPTEYWGQWTVYAHHVHIQGTKRKDRNRMIPKLFPCAIYDGETIPRPAITLSSFARALNIVRVATGIEVAPYDLRRTFGNWLEQAGILRSRRQQYMGHAIADVTERYERHEVTPFLLDDGATVRAWIAASIENANARQAATETN